MPDTAFAPTGRILCLRVSGDQNKKMEIPGVHAAAGSVHITWMADKMGRPIADNINGIPSEARSDVAAMNIFIIREE